MGRGLPTDLQERRTLITIKNGDFYADAELEQVRTYVRDKMQNKGDGRSIGEVQ